MMSAEVATLGLLKIKVFWNKGYDVKSSAHDLTNKVLSGESNYILDLIMWPVAKGLKLSQKIFGANFNVCRSCREKLVGERGGGGGDGLFATHPQ